MKGNITNRENHALSGKWATIAVLLLLSGPAPAVAQQGKLIFGWVEEVVVSQSVFTMHAKLDTGADTSSLDAQDIERFERDGEPWVRFTLSGEEPGQTTTLERPLVRDVLIKRHRGPSQRRPVVTVPICLGPFLMEIEVSLIDRSHFNYPVLIGRAAMEGVAVVDSERALTHDPECAELQRDPLPAWLFSSSFEAGEDTPHNGRIVQLFVDHAGPPPPLRLAPRPPMVE